MPRWCRKCRANREDQRARERIAVRRCYKCRKPLPEAARKPGKAVCDECRVDPRKRNRAYEQRRRLRKYGLTQQEYDRLLVVQGGGCLGCGRDDPGTKGWCIHHDHRSGKVLALLCNRCNTAIGLADEDSTILRALADLVDRLNRVR